MKPFGKLLVTTLAVSAVGLIGMVPAHASVTFTPGNHPQANEENVLFQNLVTGNPVVGETNQSHTLVDFSSNQDIQGQGLGQSDISSLVGDLTTVTITVPNGSYGDIIFDPEISQDQDSEIRDNGPDSDPDGGNATVTVHTNLSDYTYGTGGEYNIGNGQNYLTIIADPGEQILSTTITMQDDAVFDDLKDVRISDAASSTPVTPEPCSLALLGMGGLPLLGRLRRRTRQA